MGIRTVHLHQQGAKLHHRSLDQSEEIVAKEYEILLLKKLGLLEER